MLLAVDVGNTQTVLGLYEGEILHHMWRVTTNKTDTSDELRIKLLALLNAADVEPSKVEGIVLASVVPTLTASWVHIGASMFKEDTLVVTAKEAGSLFRTSYRNPDEIGADRVADAVAAAVLYGAPVIVVDFGTATNIEVVDKQGVFIGGIIAPGMETSAAALFSRAERLSTIDLVAPKAVIGCTTTQAVQAGIVYGEVDRVDGLIKRIFTQLGYETPVVGTGGLAESLSHMSATITEVNAELTLVGLRLIYNNRGD